MGLSDPCFGKITLDVFGFFKTDRKAHIGFLSGLYAPSLRNNMNQLHRLTAIFCCVKGMHYTHSQKKYLTRLYILSVLMAVFQAYAQAELNMIRTWFSICLIIYILDMKEKNPERYKWTLCAYIIYQVFACIINAILVFQSSAYSETFFIYLFPALMGSIFALDGGLVYVTVGLVIYLFQDDKVKLSVSYSLGVAAYTFLMAYPVIPAVLFRIRQFFPFGDIISDVFTYLLEAIIGIEPMQMSSDLLHESYQWMMIFALPFVLLYNEKKGHNLKWFFYIFYPVHIILFWFISHKVFGLA
jgi:hypothetical protein